MKKVLKIKENIKTEIFERLININEVISVTIVGSFIDNEDLSGISDIDTIVICNNLNQEIFNNCVNAINSINLNRCGLNNYNLKINSTFGPLKFDKPKLAVVHLMIYDIKGHKNHVISSPFTCFDWERSKDFVGLSLAEVYSVGRLQIRDFKEARRSLENYLIDLKNNSISYREYNFQNTIAKEVIKQAPLDDRHMGEFAFHIVKNLIMNYYKLCNMKNEVLSKHKVVKQIKNLFSGNISHTHSEKYLKISNIKDKRGGLFPKYTLDWVGNFIEQFKNIISEEWDDAIQINFIRHFKTNLNDGTYLGQGRDPDLDYEQVFELNLKKVNKVYSSPLKRCTQTAKNVHEGVKIISDDRLLEFDYGDAEGLQQEDLTKKYPKVQSSWDIGEDPHFPNGENTADVFKRLMNFMNELSKNFNKNKDDAISIFTHNGVLRCLIGDAYKIKKSDWYKIVIPHGLPLEFLYNKNRFYPNIPRAILGKLFINIGILR